MSCVPSPYAHLTVHHTWGVKLSQQILHLVVFLAILLYVSMVTRDVRTKHIIHQQGQAALLAFTVFLKNRVDKRISEAVGHSDSVVKKEEVLKAGIIKSKLV